MKQFAIVIDKGPTSYGAYVPDLPGCAAVGETEDEVRQLIREGIALHIQALIEDGEPIPEPTRTSTANPGPTPKTPPHP